MIVAEHDQSDTASTNTLVTAQLQRVPRHYLLLISISCIVSLLCFCFVLADVANSNPELAIAAILAYVFFLPYQGAALLLHWLHCHQTESIFPFTPSSPQATAYGFFLVLLWTACTIIAGLRLNQQILLFPRSRPCYIPPQQGTLQSCTVINNATIYWPSIASVTASSLQLLLLIGIVWVCLKHRKAVAISPTLEPSSTRSSSPTVSKVISA